MTTEKNGETIDTLTQSGYKIIQGKKDFKFGLDAFLLSWYANPVIYKKDVVVDLCTGTGIVPLLLSGCSNAAQISGLEIQHISADMANRSVLMNGLQEKVHIIEGDLKNVSDFFPRHRVDVVTVNPPYMIFQHGKQNPADSKAIARHEVLCNLEDIIRAAAYLLTPTGTLCMVHRPFRLAEIFGVMNKYNLEPKRMQLVHPFADKEPNMVLIEARKNAASRLTVEKPLVVYKEPGVYTEDIDRIYGRV